MHNHLTSAAVPLRTTNRGLIARRPLAMFFALAFGLTWSLLIADALGQRGMAQEMMQRDRRIVLRKCEPGQVRGHRSMEVKTARLDLLQNCHAGKRLADRADRKAG